MYSKETYEQPFWAENSGFMTGRDPLGIQNSSITLYARLLPGMTNLTLRIRYYGLYCWLLSEYHSLNDIKINKNLEHQYNFVRKAELTIAFIMARLFPEELYVIGSDYVAKNIDQDKEFGYYKVDKGAEKFKDTPKGTVYWDFISGALGQYYAGTLINLELIEILNKFFHLRDLGNELANAFKNSIPEAKRTKFLEVITKGQLSYQDITDLKSFALNAIPADSDEWHFYKRLLLNNDGEKLKTSDGNFSVKRKETIGLYLKYCRDKSNIFKFNEYQFLDVDMAIYNADARVGWYYYFVIESFHYALETILWAMLVELDGKTIPVQDFIKETADHMLKESLELSNGRVELTITEILAGLEAKDLIAELKFLEQLSKSPTNSKRALGFAIKIIFQIYLQIENKLKGILIFENLNYLRNQKGILTELVDNLIEKHLLTKYRHYLEQVVKLIINDHISTAFRKMNNSEVSLLKFMIEDNMITHIQTMEPKHTNPRIKTLQSFLIDLNFLEKTELLTLEGEYLLDQIK